MMLKLRQYGLLILALLGITVSAASQELNYPWINFSNNQINRHIADISTPEGYKRIELGENSFGNWLQHLPLLHNGSPMRLFNGQLKQNQNAHHAIVDIDVGTTDLQQCADAVIRLYAEYLYSCNLQDKIAFHFTNGDLASYSNWLSGCRPKVNGNRVAWIHGDSVNDSHNVFRQYLNMIFTYAGSFRWRANCNRSQFRTSK
ncbi:hypothetical protein JW960_18395 [candidate division KSB1 bacterium]|nr:hypothetical protein [candidate division KSB1 bacterium]